MKGAGERVPPLVHPSWTEYNTDPHSKYALLVSAAANIDIRVYTWGRLVEPEELACSLETDELACAASPPGRWYSSWQLGQFYRKLFISQPHGNSKILKYSTILSLYHSWIYYFSKLVITQYNLFSCYKSRGKYKFTKDLCCLKYILGEIFLKISKNFFRKHILFKCFILFSINKFLLSCKLSCILKSGEIYPTLSLCAK